MNERDTRSMAVRGRIGAFAMHAKHDVQQTSAPGRAAFLARFARQVDPDGTLPPAERERRARAALCAHMQRLAYKRGKQLSKGGKGSRA